MKNCRRSFRWVLALVGVIAGVTAYVGAKESNGAVVRRLPEGAVALDAQLVQGKVHKGSDGHVSVAVTFSAEDLVPSDRAPVQYVDLVLVLDRSGSMSGVKINDARQAVIQLIDRLSAHDRLALVTYSNGVETVSPLVAMDHHHRQRLKSAVAQIYAGGGTNLGGGLQGGIDTLLRTPAQGRKRSVILISDGLANNGITDPRVLGQMAARASENQLAVSTLGVGYDFNEVLMTTIADHGAGRYYFLENPHEFARIFEQAFQSARHVAASGVEIRIPLNKGMRLLNAGGYPITTDKNEAVIYPGDLLAGQQRKLFLTFQVPTDKERRFTIDSLAMNYSRNSRHERVQSGGPMIIACVADPKAVRASIDKKAWEGQVVQEAYGKLKEEVAEAIRKGQKEKALAHIEAYESENREVNTAVGSAMVADNLDTDVQRLRQGVEQTFSGPPAAVAEKKKQRAKTLQYDSYKSRRGKQ